MNYFGTDGIRQKADKFTPEFLANIVKGLVNYAGDNIKIFLAGDTRESTEWILQDLATACETFGLEYSSAGVLPTPAINYCFFEMGFDFAIDVTASHNEYLDNGIKIFERGETTGQKLSEPGRACVEQALASAQTYALASPTYREDLHSEAVELYKKHLKSYIGEASFKGLTIGVDCANGATGVINTQIFEELGAETQLIHAETHYGTKINKACGSTHLDSLQQLVQDNHLNLGVAFDGDGDRCLMIDHTGATVDGDEILAILANYLGLDAFATTVMANQGLLNWAKDNGINLEITAVGDHHVAETMRAKGISLGGEQSGHIILPGEATGDGMLTALMVTKVIASTGNSLKALASIFTKSPQVIVNMPATAEQKASLKSSDEAKALLLDYSHQLDNCHGRLLVRPSGTEELIRITIWGDDEQLITTLANELKAKLEEIL